jgi:hypothetical protein
MKHKKPYERYDTLLQELVKAHTTIYSTHDLLQELNVPVDITNKLGFVLRTIKITFEEIEKLKSTEEFLWKDNLSQFEIIQ